MGHLSTSLPADTTQLDLLAVVAAGAVMGRSRCVSFVEMMTKSVLEAAAVVAAAGNSSNFDSLEFTKEEK